MDKAKHARGGLSVITVLSLGFIILGIGCISWAVFSLWTQTNYSEDALQSSYFIKSATTEEKINSLNDDANQVSVNNSLYSMYPAEGDKVGVLTIPVLAKDYPIYQGTSAKELKKGVGHFIQSVLPGEEDNCVLSGHRETVFRRLGKLKIGDQLIVKTVAGTFTYEVTGTRIVDKDDKTVIVPTELAVLTLTTCYPFNTPGYFPQRYIVSAVLVNSSS